jgi:hypothetical protein
MQFQPIPNIASCPHHPFILRCISIGERTRKYLADLLSQQFPFFVKSNAVDQRLVDGTVATIGVLDEEGDVGQMIKKLHHCRHGRRQQFGEQLDLGRNFRTMNRTH